MATQQEKDHLRHFTENFDFLPPHVKRTVRERLEKLMRGDSTPAARDGFLPFVRAVWPTYIHGRHREVMADAFERITNGKLKRCIINLPPRSTKSKFASVLFPAWYLGKYPDHKIFEGLALDRPGYGLWPRVAQPDREGRISTGLSTRQTSARCPRRAPLAD
jgi:hypothetical protein